MQTIDRIEKGHDCRLVTKRKIILALGFQLGDRSKIFVDVDGNSPEGRVEEIVSDEPREVTQRLKVLEQDRRKDKKSSRVSS